MTLAWDFARQEHWSCRLPEGTLRTLFPHALRRAWAHLRAAAVRIAESIAQVATLDLDALRAEVMSLENTDRHGHAGIERLSAARAALAEKEAADYAAKRALIAQASGRFCSVTFIKKDGTLRQMRVQPAKLKKHIKGDTASITARKAAQTRRERHPNLMPVWDAKKGAARSINLATVTRIAANG